MADRLLTEKELEARRQAIISLRRGKFTLEEIRRPFNITRERVRQIIAGVVKKYGAQVLEPKRKRYWTLQEAGAAFKTNPDTVRHLCRTEKVSFVRRGINGTARLYVTKRGMGELKAYLISSRSCICTICQKKFTVRIKGKRPRVICYSEACRRKYNAKKRAEFLSDKESLPSKISGWRKAVHRALLSHKIPENEEWLSFGEALKVSGLDTKIKLYYLYRCSLVTTCLHPARKARRTGEKLRIYAKSEMEIIRQVLAPSPDLAATF